MARPKSGNKREAILAAAASAVAEQGLGASTSSISQRAGIAEGTLFTYFATKDELLQQLFLDLKREAYAAVDQDFPHQAPAKAQARYFFDRYVDWGVKHPHKRHALAQLVSSEKIPSGLKEQADMASQGNAAVLESRLAAGGLKDSDPDFGMAIMHSLAEVTMEFMARHPQQADTYRNAGFDAFWRAIGR